MRRDRRLDLLPQGFQSAVGIGIQGFQHPAHHFLGRHIGIDVTRGVALGNSHAHLRISQRRTQTHEIIHAHIVVRRNAEIAEILLQTVALCADDDRHTVNIHRRRVLNILRRITAVVTQHISDARTEILKLFFLAGRTHGVAEHVLRAWAGGLIDRKHIDRLELAPLQCVIFIIERKFALSADFGINRLALAVRAKQRMHLQMHHGLVRVKAGLIQRHTFVAQRVIHADGLAELLAGFLILHRHFRGKMLGHTGAVIFDNEFVQTHPKR